ncbi:MAG: hemolysin III family protein [Bacteroidia bacterium]|nr:hemolysin III family protein [Bacteroidia bacterium]
MIKKLKHWFTHELEPTKSEEVFNSISHGIGAVLCVIGFFFLLDKTNMVNDTMHTTGHIVYISSFFCIYTASMVYHLVSHPKAKYWMRVIDHSMIFVGIAGTYMPFLLSNMRNDGGYPYAIVLAGICLAGFIFKFFLTGKYKLLSVLIYVGMGANIVFSKMYSVEFIKPEGLFLIKVGGILYLAGVLFYTLKSLRYTHFIWHLFVLGGSICHFFAVYNYAIIQS